ncbi:DMT family transporter [Falsiroseomonas oryzae]|uniref:DMT family transporter n=1 Tax=Falsiroseomonas oryzae TaxID=2766473 RepID=UPI0022EB69DB|nr:DMT family transporter [Roseomonas sp. MO-31]
MRDADNLRGAALMSAAAVIFAVEALSLRWLTARGVPVEMQVAARAAGQMAWVLPVILARGPRVLRTQRLGMHLLRGLSSLSCWGLYYLSVARLDLATAAALSFTNVVFTTLLAGPILGERVDRWRWAGALVGLAGIAVMLRPGGDWDLVGALAGLGGAIAWCGITLTSRSLTRTDGTATILAWVGLITFGGALPFAVAAWTPIGAPEWAVMIGTALVTPSIIWLVTEALRAGEASAVSPFQYLRLPLLAVVGWLAWGEVPDLFAWAGAVAILAGALIVTVSEARRR